tara:strand:- start:664 stop:1497 length:834 start_codon:yes stop_codon:yes gene_type:complete
MKVIFDIGANKGQNLNYFLEKADIVVAIEANINLVKKIQSDFKQFVDSGKLIIENVALTNNENIKQIDFYISKVDDVLSTVYPDDINKFYKQQVRCDKASLLIQKYLKDYNISEIEYIKIDIEGSDKLVLDDLLQHNILAKNLSAECQEPEVLELLLNSPYKSFKFVEGGGVTFKKNIEVMTKYNNKKKINFDIHSSGPYGDDIPGDYYSKTSILPYFLNKGLGWKDIHCSLEKKKYPLKIRYLHGTHQVGFRHHFKYLVLSFTKAVRNRIKKIFNK